MLRLGSPLASMSDSTLIGLCERQTVFRIWNCDHTVWSQSTHNIVDRLGWLRPCETADLTFSDIQTFTEQIHHHGFTHAVILGMGGSCLGAKMLTDFFPAGPDGLKIHFVDSTIPEALLEITKIVDLRRTLFIVASKSGTTMEVLFLYKYFKEVVGRALSQREVTRRFVAITDDGSYLQKLAVDEGFLKIFLNPSAIGGRYSVFSYFGMVPAALAGIDIARLLDEAKEMAQSCTLPIEDGKNPGAVLGAVMGAMANVGRDKLTIVTSPSLTCVAAWIEQLIAESTGKMGRGLVPVIKEPVGRPAHYGNTRIFVYLRLDSDDNVVMDRAVSDLNKYGQYVAQVDLSDKYELGSALFMWLFATAVACAVICVNPFDQPDVDSSKSLTRTLILSSEPKGAMRLYERTQPLASLLSVSSDSDYLAILCFVDVTNELQAALGRLRRRVAEKFSIPTTIGLGPAYLHSTGQLHKGGPPTGIFLCLNRADGEDIPIPGERFTFGFLTQALAKGDLDTLRSGGRRLAVMQLGVDPVTDIDRLIRSLK